MRLSLDALDLNLLTAAQRNRVAPCAAFLVLFTSGRLRARGKTPDQQMPAHIHTHTTNKLTLEYIWVVMALLARAGGYP